MFGTTKAIDRLTEATNMLVAEQARANRYLHRMLDANEETATILRCNETTTLDNIKAMAESLDTITGRLELAENLIIILRTELESHTSLQRHTRRKPIDLAAAEHIADAHVEEEVTIEEVLARSGVAMA